MADDLRFIGERSARQLSNTTKTPPIWRGTTPRWLVQMLPWAPVEAGVYRVNQALEDDFAVRCTPDPKEVLPNALNDYEPQPREYVLSTVTTTVSVHTRISDLFRSPMDQVREQLGRVAPGCHEDHPVASDRRLGHHHLDARGIATRRVSRTPSGQSLARAALRVARVQVILQPGVRARDRRDLRRDVPEGPRIDVEDADQRLPGLGGHPAPFARLAVHHVGGDQDEHEHEDDLHEQIDQRRERDVPVVGEARAAAHRRYSTLLRMKRDASIR